MAFSLPDNLSTSWVDDSSTIHGSDWNNITTMGNALKSAIGTFGFNIKSNITTASETTTSATYADLTTTTDYVVVPVGSSGSVLLFFGAQFTNSGANYCYISVDVSGANTIAASDTNAIQAAVHSGSVLKSYGNSILLTGLTAGFTTFKLKYRVNTGTGTFSNRKIAAIPLPATDGTHESGAFALNPSISLGFGGLLENRPIYDSVGAGSAGLGTTRSYTHTVGADAKAVIVYMNTSSASYSTTTAPSPTVTFGGQAMTLLGRTYAFTNGSTWTWLCAYGLLNPPTGAQTVSATLANSYTAMNSVAYTDVVGWGAVTVKTASSTNPSITSPSATGRKVVSGALATYTQSMSSVTPNQRSIQNYSSGSNYGLAIGDGDGPYGNTIACTAATGSWGGLTVELMRTVPTYTKPTWVGTGIGINRQAQPTGTWIDTVPADANLALVWISEMPSDHLNTCSVTLGGTSMVEVTGSPWEFEITSGTYNRIRCFALQNPPTGPNKTITVTSNVNNCFHAHSVYYGGVTSVSSTNAFVRGASTTQPSLTISNSSSNHLYAQCFAYRGESDASTFTAFNPNTGWRGVHSNLGGYTVPMTFGDSYGNDGTLTVGATRNHTTYGWAGISIDLSPAALPTPSVPTFVGAGAGRTHVPSPTISWVETIPSNATCAIVWLSVMGSTAASAVTIGGTAATALQGSPFTYYSGNYSTQAFFLMNPPTGANKTISISYSGGNYVNAIATYYGGVASIWNPTNTSGAGSTAPSLDVASTATDHLYVNAFCYRPGAGDNNFPTYSQTKRAEWYSYSYDNPIIVGDAVGNGGTLNFSATRNNSTYEWGGLAIDLSP